MRRKAQLHIDLDASLAEEFSAAVDSARTSEAEVLREMVQDYVDRQKMEPDYRRFLEAKVSRARDDIAAGRIMSAEETEELFAERRQKAMTQGSAV